MKKSLSKVLVLSAILLGGGLVAHGENAEASTLLRVYNPNTGEHHYTANTYERTNLVHVGWRNEGTAWNTPDTGGTNVYRLYNPNTGDHHYTLNSNEKNNLVHVGWRYEGIGWKSGGSTPVYRLYNPNAKTGTHHYTMLKSEKDSLVHAGWRYEGVGFYSTSGQSGSSNNNNNKPNQTVAPRKVDVNVTGIGGSEQRVSGSYRYLYSNKAFDQAKLGSTASIEFSADIAISGTTNDYETQFVIAGNGIGNGQVGVGLHYQAGSDSNFAQGRINTTNINFPAQSNTQGQQYYSVNTNAPRINRGQKVHLQVKYFDSGYMQTFVNGVLTGQYKTNLIAGGDAYILHDNTNAPTQITNLKVLNNGKDVTHSGVPSFESTNFNISSGAVSGAYLK